MNDEDILGYIALDEHGDTVLTGSSFSGHTVKLYQSKGRARTVSRSRGGEAILEVRRSSCRSI